MKIVKCTIVMVVGLTNQFWNSVALREWWLRRNEVGFDDTKRAATRSWALNQVQDRWSDAHRDMAIRFCCMRSLTLAYTSQ